MVKGYCMKDKTKVDMTDVSYSLNKRGSPMAAGKCPKCGGKVFAMLGKDNTPADLRAKADAFKAKHGKGEISGGGKKRSRRSKSHSKSGGGKRRSRKSRSRK